MHVPDDRRYTADHEWARLVDGTVRVGITDYAQDALGDVVYVDLPAVGAHVDVGGVLGEVESTKSVSEIYAPIAGKVVAVNTALADAPELLNADPYGAGWISEIAPDRRRRTRPDSSTRRVTRRSSPSSPTSGGPGGRASVDGVFCNNCGHRNPGDANFCSSCGAVLSPAPHPDTTVTLHPVDAQGEAGDEELTVTFPTAPAAPGSWWSKRGPNAGTRFDLVTDVTRAGRHPESDIFLDDITVSRRHAEFQQEPRWVHGARRGLAQRHVREPRAHRRSGARPRRRGADREVQARLPGGGGRVSDLAGRDTVSGRTYLSIGDVLALLRQEFPDVTISKIRFLESQGLVNPERTPSGYRKFYEHDVERLRWVLRQQREHFLPLKVIKGRLEQEVSDTATTTATTASEGIDDARDTRARPGGTQRPAPVAPGRRGASSRASRPGAPRPSAGAPIRVSGAGSPVPPAATLTRGVVWWPAPAPACDAVVGRGAEHRARRPPSAGSPARRGPPGRDAGPRRERHGPGGPAGPADPRTSAGRGSRAACGGDRPTPTKVPGKLPWASTDRGPRHPRPAHAPAPRHHGGGGR